MKIVRNNQTKPYIIYLRDEQITENPYYNCDAVMIRWNDGSGMQGSTLQAIYPITSEQANAIRNENHD